MAPDKVCPNCDAAIEGDVCPACAPTTGSSEHETFIGDPRLAPITSSSFTEPDEDEPEEGEGEMLGLDLATEPSPAAAPAPRALAAPPQSEPSAVPEHGHDHDHDHDYDHGGIVTRSAWPIALLFGYAMAATLACGWLWWNGPTRPVGTARRLGRRPRGDRGGRPAPRSRPPRTPRAAVAPARPSSSPPSRSPPTGSSGSASRRRSTTWRSSRSTSRPARSGSSDPQFDGSRSSRPGGDGALRAAAPAPERVGHAIFAPLDEAFVREPDRRLPDTFIESSQGERVYAYRLPVDSEWIIDGQRFVELRPGESIETPIVSDVDAIDRLDGPLTWRIKLRTAPETTAVVGVTFDAGAVEHRL